MSKKVMTLGRQQKDVVFIAISYQSQQPFPQFFEKKLKVGDYPDDMHCNIQIAVNAIKKSI